MVVTTVSSRVACASRGSPINRRSTGAGSASPVVSRKVASLFSVCELAADTEATATLSSVALCWMNGAVAPPVVAWSEIAWPLPLAEDTPGVGLLVVVKSAQLLSVSAPSGLRVALVPMPAVTAGAGATHTRAPLWSPSPSQGSTSVP